MEMDIFLKLQFLSKLHERLFVVSSSINVELDFRNTVNKLSDRLNCEIYPKPFCECSMIDKLEWLRIPFMQLHCSSPYTICSQAHSVTLKSLPNLFLALPKHPAVDGSHK